MGILRTLLSLSSGGNDQIVITDPYIGQIYGAVQKLAAKSQFAGA
jgi:hypothetical protein